MDGAGDQRSTDAPEAINPTRKEFRKTWGIRTTMITQREGAGDTEVDPAKQRPHSPSLRHSRRWLKRMKQVGELLSTVWRQGGEDVAVSLKDPREPVSCRVAPVQSASEGSIKSSSEMKSAPAPGSKSVKERPASSKKAGGWGELCDTSDSDSDCFTLEGLQNRLPRKPEQEPAERWLKGVRSRLREQCREEDPSNTVEVEAGSAGHSVPPCKQDTDTEAAQRAVNQVAKDDRERESEAARVQGPKDKDPGDLGRPRHEGYDPNALYCICRQPHGNRLICCDRCEEWFHGDCVGISEARGQLLERNRDGHLCPDCTTLRAQDKRTSEATDDQEPGRRPGGADDTERKSRGTGEQKSGADRGARVELRNPQATAVTVAPGAVPCAGPGCSSVAQPDTVYCSSDCILKHAAAAMRLLSAQKGHKPKPKKKVKVKPEELCLPKPSMQAGIKMSFVHKRPAPDEIENPVKKVMVTPPRGDTLGKEAAGESSTASWASDHKSSAVMAEKTAAPSPPRWAEVHTTHPTPPAEAFVSSRSGSFPLLPHRVSSVDLVGTWASSLAQTLNIAEQQESVRAAPEKSTAPLLDVFSSMLKGTTSQHRALCSSSPLQLPRSLSVFDLNCKICTGQVPSEDEPAPKKQKLSISAKKEDLKPKSGSSSPDPVPHLSSEGSAVALPKGASEPHPERASGPEPERKYVPVLPGDRCAGPSPLEGLSSCPVGMVTTVTVSSRDPRTAVVTVTASAASHLDSAHTVEARPDLLKPALPSVTLPESILAKPSSTLDLRRLSVPPSPSVGISESQSPQIGDRTLSLPHLTNIWKGLINMQSVGKFVTKAYPASGSCVCLSEDLPDTMHVGGRIAPKTVWDYVGKLQSSVSKELCLIRFQPATREEEGAYTSLSSYFSGCGRFGVVTNTHGRVRDLYLIPLRAEDAVPPALLPFAGPGKCPPSGRSLDVSVPTWPPHGHRVLPRCHGQICCTHQTGTFHEAALRE
ncbi:LOW QUALITY PROTEIN: death-inducer obliterator 1-like [Erethizon dorsatum]